MSNKKTSKKKKIIISLSVVLSFVLICFASFAIIYHPRALSKYIHANKSDLNKIEIVYYNEETLEALEIDKDKSEQFLSELLKIKVRRQIFTLKARSYYSVNIYFETKTYQINAYYISDGDSTTYIEGMENKFHNLVKVYSGGAIQ